MRNDLISVIIPAYNSEQYILRCLDSVFNQTYKNIEIIVVNDGSTDKTREIVEQLDNVILLNKENGGLCSSRKYGVKNSKGKYIIFLDSDDYLESDFIEKLYSETSGRSDELIMCGFITNGIKDNVGSNRLCAEGRESIYNLFLHKGILNKSNSESWSLVYLKDNIDTTKVIDATKSEANGIFVVMSDGRILEYKNDKFAFAGVVPEKPIAMNHSTFLWVASKESLFILKSDEENETEGKSFVRIPIYAEGVVIGAFVAENKNEVIIFTDSGVKLIQISQDK